MTTATPFVSDPLVQKYLDEVTRKYNKTASIQPKSSSKLIRALGWLLKVTRINTKMMDAYATTIGDTIYVPDDFFAKGHPLKHLECIAHESVHVRQDAMSPVTFRLLYLFPQVLAPLFFLTVLIFGALHFCLWMILFLVLGLIASSPLPAWWRFQYESEAYGCSIIMAKSVFHQNEAGVQHVVDWIVPQLTSNLYYFAWPFESSVRSRLSKVSGSEEVYKDLNSFISRNNVSF